MSSVAFGQMLLKNSLSSKMGSLAEHFDLRNRAVIDDCPPGKVSRCPENIRFRVFQQSRHPADVRLVPFKLMISSGCASSQNQRITPFYCRSDMEFVDRYPRFENRLWLIFERYLQPAHDPQYATGRKSRLHRQQPQAFCRSAQAIQNRLEARNATKPQPEIWVFKASRKAPTKPITEPVHSVVFWLIIKRFSHMSQ